MPASPPPTLHLALSWSGIESSDATELGKVKEALGTSKDLQRGFFDTHTTPPMNGSDVDHDQASLSLAGEINQKLPHGKKITVDHGHEIASLDDPPLYVRDENGNLRAVHNHAIIRDGGVVSFKRGFDLVAICAQYSYRVPYPAPRPAVDATLVYSLKE